MARRSGSRHPSDSDAVGFETVATQIGHSLLGMSRRRTLPLLASAAIFGVLAACGGGGDSDDPSALSAATSTGSAVPDVTATTTPGGTFPPGADPAFCDPMQRLANYNAATPSPDLESDWGTVQEEFAEARGQGTALYDEAIAAAPEDVRPNLETLRDYTNTVFDQIAGASSLEEFAAELGTPPENVISATRALDSYIQETCGFGLTSG